MPPRVGENGATAASRAPRTSCFPLATLCGIKALERPVPFPHCLLPAASASRGVAMTFDQVLAQPLALLKRKGRVTYSALKRRFDRDDPYLKDLKDERLYVYESEVEADERGFTWTGATEDIQGTTRPSDRTEPQSVIEQAPPAQEISV